MGFWDSIEASAHGPVRPQIICPHCGVGGRVRVKTVKRKKGVSGKKAAGAVLTGGISVVATGLSRKERSTEARCGNCLTVWHIL